MHLNQGLAPSLWGVSQIARALLAQGPLLSQFLPVGAARPQAICLPFTSPDRKSPPVTEVKVTSGRVGKEDRKGPSQEKKQLGIKDKDDKKGAKLPPGKEAGSTSSGPGGVGWGRDRRGCGRWAVTPA